MYVFSSRTAQFFQKVDGLSKINKPCRLVPVPEKGQKKIPSYIRRNSRTSATAAAACLEKEEKKKKRERKKKWKRRGEKRKGKKKITYIYKKERIRFPEASPPRIRA